MAEQRGPKPLGHVFLSYVREDSARVGRLVRLLESSHIRVWRDTDDLLPGQDWKAEIRAAIGRDALAFVACFSANSEMKGVTHQNEELTLAIEQLRLRRPGVPWLIPVRFDDCSVPDIAIGGGRTLSDLNRLDLFDDDWSKADRLVRVVTEVLGGGRADEVEPSPTATDLRSPLLDPSRTGEVEDRVSAAVDALCADLGDTSTFPTERGRRGSADFLALLCSQVDRYIDRAADVVGILVLAGTYGTHRHNGLWTRALGRLIAVADSSPDGNDLLVNLRGLPVCLAMHGLALGAVHSGNWDPLRAVVAAVPANSRRGSEPLVARARPAAVFGENLELAAAVLQDIERRSRSHGHSLPQRPKADLATPAEVIRVAVRRILGDSGVIGPTGYADLFDRTEVHLGLAAEYEARNASPTSGNRSGGWPGAFVRGGPADSPDSWVERRIVAELISAGDSWPPLRAGLFSGRAEIARSVAETYLATMRQSRIRAVAF